MSLGVMRSDLEVGRGAVLHPVGRPLTSPPAAAAGVPRGIIFDVADVLYDATHWRRWLLRIVARMGVSASYTDFYRTWDHEYLIDVHRGRREFSEALHAFLLAAGLRWAQIDEVEAASRIQRRNLELNARALPGVIKAVDHLAGLGLPLVAWADAPHTGAKLAERLDRLGLGNRFQATLSSFDLELAQPEPRCYLAALETIGLAAHEAIYVGHDAQHLAGAKAVGLLTVAVNFESQAGADHYLTRFEDLVRLVHTLTASRCERPAKSSPLADTRVECLVPPGEAR